MAKYNFERTFEATYNPFEAKIDYNGLKECLNEIDNRNIRRTFKNADDPITLAFESIEKTSLKKLAKDFVKESFCDVVSFITKVCK